jgi:hypothetical protein
MALRLYKLATTDWTSKLRKSRIAFEDEYERKVERGLGWFPSTANAGSRALVDRSLRSSKTGLFLPSTLTVVSQSVTDQVTPEALNDILSRCWSQKIREAVEGVLEFYRRRSEARHREIDDGSSIVWAKGAKRRIVKDPVLRSL